MQRPISSVILPKAFSTLGTSPLSNVGGFISTSGGGPLAGGGAAGEGGAEAVAEGGAEGAGAAESRGGGGAAEETGGPDGAASRGGTESRGGGEPEDPDGAAGSACAAEASCWGGGGSHGAPFSSGARHRTKPRCGSSSMPCGQRIPAIMAGFGAFDDFSGAPAGGAADRACGAGAADRACGAGACCCRARDRPAPVGSAFASLDGLVFAVGEAGAPEAGPEGAGPDFAAAGAELAPPSGIPPTHAATDDKPTRTPPKTRYSCLRVLTCLPLPNYARGGRLHSLHGPRSQAPE
jgi:hypothetical protein